MAFFKKCEKLLGRKQLIVDVCGSHGLIGALFVAFGRAQRAVVLDIFQPQSFAQLCEAWRPWLSTPLQLCAEVSDEAGAPTGPVTPAVAPNDPSVAVRFEVGDFYTTLPALLDSLPPADVGVVACHACSHLTDGIIAMCVERGVKFAVMPCCQRDLQTQNQMAVVAKSLGIKEDAAIDVARMGGILARGYDCRWRTIDAAITPKNRMLVGLGQVKSEAIDARRRIRDESTVKLGKIYKRVYEQAAPATTTTAAAAASCG